MATRPFLKGSFFGKQLFFLMNLTNENERFINAFLRPRLLCGLSVVRGNYGLGEQKMHLKRGREKDERWRKKFLRPFPKRIKVRVGLGSPSSFVVPSTTCSEHVRIMTPRPSSAMMSIGKRSLSSSMSTPLPSTYAFQLDPVSSFGSTALGAPQFAR